MDISARTTGFRSITRLFPIGAVSMVSPFNFPLNLTAHKIAPALAVGYALGPTVCFPLFLSHTSSYLLLVPLSSFKYPTAPTWVCESLVSGSVKKAA